MSPVLPWILASLSLVLLLGAAGLWLWRGRRPRPLPLPSEWALSSRPVFSSDERRVYRQLREAFPTHIVLSKLPLVRFCQPNDPQDVRFWYELLGAIHVTFAICSANGRVLAAIDLDNDRSGSRRSLQIKQSVLAACRVRYLRCPVEHLPSIPELQLLVPQSLGPTRGPQPAPTTPYAHEPVAAVQARRRTRQTLWQDSGFFQDSFFGSDSRLDTTTPGEFGVLRGSGDPRESGSAFDDYAAKPPHLRH